MKLKSFMKVLTSTKYDIVVLNAECKNRDAQPEDIIATARFNILEESYSVARERIDFLEKYSKGTVEFVDVNIHGAVDITVLF